MFSGGRIIQGMDRQGFQSCLLRIGLIQRSGQAIPTEYECESVITDRSYDQFDSGET